MKIVDNFLDEKNFNKIKDVIFSLGSIINQ
jgi:hypothetical protein